MELKYNNKKSNMLDELLNNVSFNQEDTKNLNTSSKFLNNTSERTFIYNESLYNINNYKNNNLLDSRNIRNKFINNNISKNNPTVKTIKIKKICIKKSTSSKFNKKANKLLNKKLPKCHSDYFKKYPKTVFQKMIIDLDKVKIKTDKVIEIMKNNIRLTNEEICRNSSYRLNQSKITNQSNKSNFNVNNTSTYFYTILKSKFKNCSNNNSSTLANFYNSSSSRNNFQNHQSNYHSRSQDYIPEFLLNSKEKLGLKKIPYIKLSSIKKELPYRPLFKIDNTKKFYKCMFHFRNFNIDEKKLFSHAYNIYNVSAVLEAQNSYNKDSDINLLNICNKIKLIQDNIEYFQINYMYKNSFLDSFKNMENHQKAKFNYVIEETCILLIKLVPLLLKNYYTAIKKMFPLGSPNIEKEMTKKPENESVCLKLNYKFFNLVNDYFNVCIEIYKIIKKKFCKFVYDEIEFVPLNTFLDLARYNTSMMNSIAVMFIRKTEKDIAILQKLEGGLKIKKKIYDKRDQLEKYIERHRSKNQDIDIKKERINNVLNFKKGDDKKIVKNKSKDVIENKSDKNNSIIYMPIIRDMMKYFKQNVREKIITQQVIERYKKLEEKRLNEGDDSSDET